MKRIKSLGFFLVSIHCLAVTEGGPDDDASVVGYEPRRLNAEQAAQDVRILRRALRKTHPGYGRYTSSEAMEALLDELERGFADGGTDTRLYLEVSRVLAFLRCDHTKAELPEALEQFRKESPSYLPFSFRLFNGRMFVDKFDNQESVLARGDEVLRISERPVGSVLTDVAQYVSVDGWTDDTKRVEMEYSSEYLGDAIDHFWPFLYGWPRTWSIEIRERQSGRIKRVVLSPVSYERWLEIAGGGDGRYVNFPDTVEFRMLDGATGYLSIGTFVNYRNPVAPESVFGPIFDTLSDKKAKRLILDLRHCGGGSDEVPATLASYLTDQVVPTGKRPPWVRTYRFGDLRKHLSTWDESVFQMPAELFTNLDNGYFEFRQPAGNQRNSSQRTNRFTGELIILSSAANASGATIFIALAQEHYGARVVGEPTGGSAEGPTAGVMLFLKLPHSGIVARVPAMRSWVNVEHPQPGRGVMPDVAVVPTFEDWLAGRDAVLEAAVR